MRKRAGKPRFYENSAYLAIDALLKTDIGKCWMTTDQILGAVSSGVKQAEIEFKISRFLKKRRGHGTRVV